MHTAQIRCKSRTVLATEWTAFVITTHQRNAEHFSCAKQNNGRLALLRKNGIANTIRE